MADVRFLAVAQDEYDDAYLWYARRNQQASDRFRAEVDRIVEAVGLMPQLYALTDATRRQALVPGFPYAVVYQIEDDGSA